MSADPKELTIGRRVVVRNAFGDLLPATVDRVPRDWRNKAGRGSETITTRGLFAKCWLKFASTGRTVPWPIDDVFTDLEDARCSTT
jgi:hypothetical protein